MSIQMVLWVLKKCVYLGKMTRTIYQTRWKWKSREETKYTSIDDEDLNKAEKVIQSWSDNTNFSRCVTAENLSLLPLCIICYPFELWISWLQWLFLNVNEAKLKCNVVAARSRWGGMICFLNHNSRQQSNFFQNISFQIMYHRSNCYLKIYRLKCI